MPLAGGAAHLRASAPERDSGGGYSLLIAKYNGLQERPEGLAGAVQSRLDGSRVNAQMLCRLFGVEFLNVAQDENLSVRIG